MIRDFSNFYDYQHNFFEWYDAVVDVSLMQTAINDEVFACGESDEYYDHIPNCSELGVRYSNIARRLLECEYSND